MSTNAPEAEKKESAPSPAPAPAATAATSTTDEDILKLRSRIDRELALVVQKLVDTEETILDIEISLRGYESGSRPRLAAISPGPGDKGAEKGTSRFRAMGDGFSKIKEWVVKKSEGPETGDAKPLSGGGSKDLDDRLEAALRSIGAEIRDREREAMELDKRLHDGHKELIRLRAQEQYARETQLRIGQTKQISEDLERHMALVDEMVRSLETATKTDSGIRTKPKETPAGPKLGDRLQALVDEALKSVAAQEKKVADLEKEMEKANGALVEERARQQRIRSMQVRLRQARYFSTDVQRSLTGLAGSIEELCRRAGNLLRPEGAKSSAPAAKPPGS